MGALDALAGNASGGGGALDALAAGGGAQKPPGAGKVLGDVENAISHSPVTKGIIDLLQRYGQARTHLETHGGAFGNVVSNPLFTLTNPMSTLWADPSVIAKGEKPEQYESDTQELERRAGLPSNWFTDTATQIGHDPTTALGASGASRAIFEHGSEAALPAIMRLWAKNADKDAVLHGGNLASAFHDFITPGGRNAAHALRTEALQNGSEGVRNYQALYGMRGGAEHQAAAISQAITTGFRRATQGLDTGERLQVYRAIDAGDVAKLPDKLRTAAEDVQRYDRAIPWLGGSASLRKQMTQHGYTLPEDLQHFDTGPRGVINADQFRQNHLPGTHELDPEDALRLEKRFRTGARGARSLTDTANPQFKERTELPVIEMDPRAIEEAFEASFRRAGRQLSAADLRKTLAQRFAPAKEVARAVPADDATITKAIDAYNAGNPLAKLTRDSFDKLAPSVQEVILRPVQESKVIGLRQKFGDVDKHIRDFFERPAEKVPEEQEGLRGALNYFGLTPKGGASGARYLSDLSRSTMFSLPFQHPMRIASLLFGHSPETILPALKKFIQTRAGFASPEAKEAVLGKAARAGATGVPNIEASKLEEAFKKIPLRAGEPLAWWFNKMQKIVWGFDDASKSALFDKYLKRYGDPYRAAYHVQQDMVDYGAPSGLTETGRMFSSFPTWRTRMPVAVARAVAKNPHIFATIARTAPWLLGTAYGEDQNKKLSSTALGEGAGAFNDPSHYLLGSLNPSTRLAIYLAMKGLKVSDYDAQRVFYGKSPGEYLLKESPLVGQAMSLSGNGLFPGSPEDNLLFQLFGIESMDNAPKSRRRSHHRHLGGSSE